MNRSITLRGTVLFVASLLVTCSICRGDWNILLTGYVLDSVTGAPVTNNVGLRGLGCHYCAPVASGLYGIWAVVSSPAIELYVFAENYAWQRAVIEITGNGTYTHDFYLVPVDGTPIVKAGPDISTTASFLPWSIYLEGVAYDPDFWPNDSAEPQWSKVSGPGNVIFDDPQCPETSASFSAYGSYELKLEYDDGAEVVSDTVKVTILKQGQLTNQCPTVDAGPPAMGATINVPLALQGSASDPDHGPQALTIEWSMVSGPGAVSFQDQHDPTTTATFSVAGTYVLLLRGSDGECESTDTLSVDVTADPTGGSGTSCEPLACWDFEEAVGTVVHDLSGNGHDGTLHGGPQWVAGDNGGALQFDGRDDYVDTQFTQNLLTWTICCWVSSPAAPSDGAPSGPIHREQNFQINWNHGDAKFRAAAGLSVGGTWYAASFGTLGANTWYHLAATYDGVSLRAYRNGELTTATSCPGTPTAENNSLKLARHAAMTQFFAGTVDEVYVYPCALSQNEIQALMSAHVMNILEVVDNGIIGDESACNSSLESQTGTRIEYTAAVLNLCDSGPSGHFDNDAPFGVVRQGHATATNVDNLSLRAEGVIRIPSDQAGNWTFGVNSDDGFTLLLPGHSFTSVTNGELFTMAEGKALQFFGGRTAADTLGVINLPAGDYPFRLSYHEAVGGAAVELFAAQGSHTIFDPEVFRLVGQREIGAVGLPGLYGEATMIVTRPGAWTGGAIDSLAKARSALTDPSSAHTNRTEKVGFVNHADPDLGGPDSGTFPGDIAFVNGVTGKDDDDFAVQVTGVLEVPADGLYQLGFNSDDGASLRVIGKSWQSVVADATGSAVIAGDTLSNDALVARTFTAGQIVLTKGYHAFEAVMFERSGGCFFELFGRGVSDRGIPDPTWHLLRTSGAQFPADVTGLQLVGAL